MNVFDPHLFVRRLTLVGVGGTGAQVARSVGRILYAMKRDRMQTPELVLIDPDRVEEKNVGRQLFAPSDVGQYKVEVVGRRLNLALGLDVRWIPDAVDAKRHFERYGANVVISCVDNHVARREMHQIDGVLIGAGNHRDSGQVYIGNVGDAEQMRRHLDGHDGRYAYLPKEGLLFPALLEPEPAESSQPAPNASCADLVAMGEQHLLINDLIATIVSGYVYKLLHRQPITTFLTYASLDGLTVRSLPICRDELSTYLSC